jgi:hypothetical protein
MKTFSFNPSLKTFCVAIFLGLTVMSCNFGQKKLWHESGVNVQKSFLLQPFTSLNVSVPMDVKIIPSNQYRIVMNVDSSLVPLISIHNENQLLQISLAKKEYFSTRSKGMIMVFVDSLYYLKNNSVGNVLFTDTLHVSHFNMVNEGVGNTSLMVVAPQLSIRNAAVGKFLVWLKTDSLNFINSAVGTTFLSGYSINSSIENSGVGSLNAKGLINQTLHMKNSGVGSAEVYAAKAFYVTNSAVGHLTLVGSGEMKELHDSGLSKTKHVIN